MKLPPFNLYEAIRATAGGRYYYLGTPFSLYRHGMEAANMQACCITAELMRADVIALSPIAHSHAIAKHAAMPPGDHELWEWFDRPLMRGACGLIVYLMPGWDESYGLTREIDWFEKEGKPIMSLPFGWTAP